MESKNNNKVISPNINNKNLNNLNNDIFKKIENIYPAQEIEGFSTKVIFKKSSNKKNTVFEPKSLITDTNYISDGGLNTKLKKYNTNNSYIKSKTFNKPINIINNSKDINLTQINSKTNESLEVKRNSKELNKKMLILQKNIKNEKNKAISSDKKNNYYYKRKNYDVKQPKIKEGKVKNEKTNNGIEKNKDKLINNNIYIYDLQNKEKNSENNKEHKNFEKKIEVLKKNNYDINNLLGNEEDDEHEDNINNKDKIINSHPNKYNNNILSQSYNFKNKIPLSSKKNFYKSKSNKSEEKKDYSNSKEILTSKVFKPHVNTLEYLENIYKETESNNFQSKNLLTDSHKNKKFNKKNKNKLLASDNNDENFRKRINKKIIKNFMKRKRNEIRINSVKEKVNKKEMNINKYINLKKLEDNINIFRKENKNSNKNTNYSLNSKNNYYIGHINNSHNKPVTPKNNKYNYLNFKFNNYNNTNDNNILENSKKTLQVSQNLYSKENINELLKDSFRTSSKNNNLQNKIIRNNDRYNNTDFNNN